MALVAALRDWLIQAGFAGQDEAALLRGLCERMQAAGVPLMSWRRMRSRNVPLLRAGTGYDVLHPEVESRGHRWLRDGTADEFVSRRADEAANDAQCLLSPFHRLWQSGAASMRRRLAHECGVDSRPVALFKFIGHRQQFLM